jgi:folylpolyglutamate synthase/dihydropteroate synthase
MMNITEHLKGVQDMKKLQAELIVAQTQKKDRQAQMEPLQELAVEVIVQEEEEKKNMVQTQAECAEMINEEITCKYWTCSEKRPCRLKHKQGNSQTSSILSQELLKKHTKLRWLGMSHMSVLGACWMQT